MSDDLKRVGLVFKADGAIDFKKSLNEINSSIKENYSEFKLAQSQWDDSTTSMEKMRVRQEFLAKQTAEYSDKVKLLEIELKELENTENRNEDAIHKKAAQLNQAKTQLNNYQKGLNAVEKELKSGTAKLKDYTKKLDDFSDKAKNVGDSLSGVSAAATGVLAGAAALVPATEEYRKIMGSLEVSSEAAGYTAEETKKTYQQLFGVLGDDQSAATTTANLQALGLSQEQLNEITNGVIGAWAKYGDSIPIDGLAEAINETVKVGTVTGTFADVLNWAGTSEDAFNEKLAACATESERANLIMQELANQGLMQTGEKWRENNKNLVEGNEATADFQEATAELAETIAPIISKLTSLAADLLSKFNDLPESVQAVIGIVLLLTSSASTLFSTIGLLSGGISKLSSFMGGASGGAKALWAIMTANPVGKVITIITALIVVIVTLYNKCEWFRNGVNHIFGSIKNAITSVTSTIEGVINSIQYMFNQLRNIHIPLPHFSIIGEFSLKPPSTPHLSVDWYAKGGILTNPTIFGMSGNHLLGGGEAGAEAVLPIDLLKRYIREENISNNTILIEAIREALSELHIVAENNIFIGNKQIDSILTEMVIKKMNEKMNDKMRFQGAKA